MSSLETYTLTVPTSSIPKRKLMQVRLNEEERQMLTELAEDAKLNSAEWVRFMIRERHAKLEQKKQPQQG